MSTATQALFDMSKARPIFDMSKAQPIGAPQAAAKQAEEKPGIVDTVKDWVSRQFPHSWEAYGEAILKPMVPGLTLAEQNLNAVERAHAAAKRGKGLGYSAAAGLASGVGADAEKMEQAAARGNPGGVIGEALPPAALAAAGPILRGAGELIPSASKASAALENVKAAAGKIPIDMSKPGNTALELLDQSQKGATLPKVVRDFVNRATKPGSEPITYADAKDFQSNVSRLSAEERMKLNPNTQRLLSQLNEDLKGSLEDAADVAGKGEQFTKAMREYHQAMTLRGYSETMKDALWKGLGVYGIKKLFFDNR